MHVLGIDPGLTGALAFYDEKSGRLVLRDMPTVKAQSKTQIVEAQLVFLIREMCPEAAVIELVHAMPRQGVTSTFNFGVGFGVLKGILAALDIPVSFLTPQEWRRLARVPGKTGDKGAARLRASQLFPEHARDFARVKDHGRADAALLVYAFINARPTASAA
jgi:crossover junction endodeoxyribonuclease RuvC